MRSSIVLCACVMLVSPALTLAEDPAWTGDGSHRLLVTVEPADLGGRDRDAMVARLAVNFADLLRAQGIAGSVDLGTLRVQRYDPATDEAQDVPARYEDTAAPTDWYSRVQRASLVDGRPKPVLRPRKARLFNRLMDNTQGHVVWSHMQEGDRPSHYAIYFDLLDAERAFGIPPAPWIGDADVLRRAAGQPLGGFAHFIAGVGDLNGDGLFDLVAGTEKGDVMWFPNLGAEDAPKFLGCHLLFDEEGPIDTGWYAAPLVIDWDGDGLNDLLVGTSSNVILWWRNVGEAHQPKFAYRGFVQTDDGRLEVPMTPVAEDKSDIFKRDYYNQPWVGDFDGDGKLDLLTGGYTTGRIFHYRETARADDGTPRLTYVGELTTADGEPIDTFWAAAPMAGDFDGDGDMDLVTGSWYWSGIHTPPGPGDDDYLWYYRNDGTAGEPKLVRVPLPATGDPPRGNIARPQAVDFDADGLTDLLVSDHGGLVYLFRNEGTATDPNWRLNSESLTAPWAFEKGFNVAGTWADFDADGQQELLVGQAVYRLGGSPHAPTLERVGGITMDGRPIQHPGPGYGDPYAYTIATDWDGDGRGDVLWGTHQGEVFLHRGVSSGRAFSVGPGERLTLTDGQPLRVGPEPVDDPAKATDFTILQGSRPVLRATDFNGDGIVDLVVSETFGNLWVFLNTVTGGVDTLRPGVQVGKMPSRTAAIHELDWNHDGLPDLLTQGTAAEPGQVWINRTEGDTPALDEAIRPFDLPYLWWGPKFVSRDWNGDGDADLLINSEFFTFWVERSFLDHGYREATLRGDGEPIQRRR